jgi:hypothetical protein
MITAARDSLPLAALALFACSAIAVGQQPTRTDDRFIVGQSVILHEGTRVPLQFAQPLSAKSAVVGQPVELVVSEDIRAAEEVVLPKGTRVLGTVATGKPSEKRGISREVAVRVDRLTARNKIIPLRGSLTRSDKDRKANKGEVVAATVALGLSGYLLATAPRNFVIPEGTVLMAYVDEDVILPAAEPALSGIK